LHTEFGGQSCPKESPTGPDANVVLLKKKQKRDFGPVSSQFRNKTTPPGLHDWKGPTNQNLAPNNAILVLEDGLLCSLFLHVAENRKYQVRSQ
jgi:hypothetical protein